MKNDMNRYQAKAIADMLLFMILATGLFAIVVCGPAVRRARNDGSAVKQTFHSSIPFDFKSHYEEKSMRDLQATELTR
ncbi:MAG TPA: hypothetical protein VEI57_10825 [Nitrospirota bacterium]|nr:hypothetical protein [Nitrospirota bacterium]